MSTKLFISILFFVSSTYALEYETVVAEKVFNSSSQVTITQDDIKKSGAETVTQLLNNKANLNFASTSVRSNEIFLRGGDASHVLVIVDGVPIYDSTTAQRAINLNVLNLKSVRKIQIIKGSQSVLYGGQAMSAVIKIDTFARDTKDAQAVALDVGTQSYGQITGAKNLNINEDSSVFFAAQATTRHNTSPVENSSQTYKSDRGQLELGYTHKAWSNFYLRSKYIDDFAESADVNSTTQFPVDSQDFTQKGKHLHSSLVFELPEARNTQVVIGHQQSHRLFEEPSSNNDQNYKGQSYHYRMDTDLYRGQSVKFYTGLSGTKEYLNFVNQGAKISETQQDLYGIYVKSEADLSDDLQLSTGIRHDWLAYNSHLTYQVGFTYFKNTKLEYATGVRHPTLFQKYAYMANPDLKVETSTTVSLSQDFYWDRLRYSLTLFDSYFSNSIKTQRVSGTTKYYNITASRTRGIENLIEHKASDTVTVGGLYTYQEPWNIAEATWLDKRALQSGSLWATYAHEKDITTFQVSGQSERMDSGYKLPGYMTANFIHSFQLTPQFSYSLKWLNMTNYRVQESKGFFAEGTQFLVGLEYLN